MEFEKGIVYNIYECGCIFKNSKDPKKYIHIKRKRKLACIKHNALFKTKYKECHCGNTVTDNRTTDSESCSKCKNDVHYKKCKNQPKEIPPKLQDPTKWNCKYWEKCGDEAIKKSGFNSEIEYDRPCKICNKYTPEQKIKIEDYFLKQYEEGNYKCDI